jgi:hypothetical protein
MAETQKEGEQDEDKVDIEGQRDDEMSMMEPEDMQSQSNVVFAEKVFIGSGAEAGAWAATLAARGVSEGALIISDQPQGTAPYDRCCLTTNLIDPTMEAARSFNNLPFCTVPVR